MKATTASLLAAATFVVGLVVTPLVNGIATYSSPAWDHKCISHGTACVGMQASAAFKPYLSEGDFGGLIGISCGFAKPGEGAGDWMNLDDLFQHGCPGARYVATFSDERHMTNFWVDKGVIVKIDYGPRHVIDL
jgi:hypothetical protein